MVRNEDNFYYNAFGDYASTITSGVGTLADLFGGIQSGKDAKSIAQKNLDTALAQGASAERIAQLNLEAKRIDAETALKLAQGKPSSSNLPLIIGASIAGVVLLGVTIWAVTKK